MADEQTQASERKVANPNIQTGSAKAPATDAPAAEAATATVYQPSSKPGGFYWGVGRRKKAVARVRLRPGEGKILVNERQVDDYFHEPKDRNAVLAPLKATDSEGKFDVWINASGGGFTGQAGAVLLGLSRALVGADPAFELMLREAGFLTRDSRMKERKKYGQRGARRRFQFSKR